ncbi:hypothetical protein O0544_17060 [Edwardsiella anguillarum]|nr:hypothetical protein [Edwardsiella anguillarum]
MQTLERQLQHDWDEIMLRINDSQLSENNALMMSLVRQYGRTCRRYFFQVISNHTLYITAATFDGDYRYLHARIPRSPTRAHTHEHSDHPTLPAVVLSSDVT